LTVIRVDKDVDNLSLTVVAEFAAPIERVWQLWADPRQLERWWGPPAYPATVERHDLTPDGEVTYFMTGPDGDRSRGRWEIASVDAPRSLEFVDGFADHDGTPRDELPTTAIRVELAEHEGVTRMEIRSTFASLEHMEQVVDLGAVEAFQLAVGQADTVLAG
jgi:uncharacterized protein YndB with AHSA1/START domain